MARSTIARIDQTALAHNLRRVRQLAPDSRVMAVVKADAYGHRLDLCIAALSGADMLAVATLDEARAIRELGNGLPVLLLEGFADPADLAEIRALDLEIVVHHESQLSALESHAGSPAPRVWLKLDSGMHRLGFPLDRLGELHRRLRALPGVEEVVLMTHFACADQSDHPLNVRQLERFDRMTAGVEAVHSLANSAGILNFPRMHRDWVRAGILLYGISPMNSGHGGDFGLRPVMTLQTRLIAVNRVPAGEAVGYGARFIAEHDMLIGVAAIGYGDGYPHSVPDGTPVLVNGLRTRLVGRVSMDMITVDLSGQPDAAVGDPVILWGSGLPVEEVALDAGTIPYELVCRVTRRVRFETAAS